MTRVQLFMMMFLSRVFITLLYMPTSTKSLNGGDSILQILIGTIILVIVAYPIDKYLNGDTKESFLKEKSRIFQIVECVVIIAAMLFFTLISLTRFNIFATTVIFPASDLRFFLLIIALCSLYCVVMGLDVLGRTAEIFFGFIVFSISFVLISTVGRIEFINFTPALYDGIKEPLKQGLFSVSQTIELFFPVFLKDKIKGGTKNFIYPWLLTTMAFLLIMVGWQSGVLGDYGKTQLFPLFSLTSLSTLGFVERLDAFITSSWLVCIFIRVAIFIYISKDCLVTVFPKVKNKDASLIIAASVGLIILLMKENYSSRLLLEKIYYPFAFFVILVIILPIIKLMRNKHEENNINNTSLCASNTI